MRSSAVILLVAFLGECFVCTWQVLSRCPTVRLPNGRVRARAKGRVVRFSCNDGFTLVGNKYSTCIRGEWDTPTPVCVNAECPIPPKPDHALMAPKYNGAILIYFCENGYLLVGTPEIYCDGKQWNSTTPYCRDTNAPAPTYCDFEKPDLCWWEQDPVHDFDWKRHNFETPSYHIGTGPTHDHTLGHGYGGYYLYIEASGRLVNDTARIISPLYNSSLTESGCFSFWYHMYGATIGALRIYFKSENEATPRLMFNKEGNQGNQWVRGLFHLPKSSVDFQIIIEGIRGNSYVSDIAIDDLAILQGDKCILDETEVTTAMQNNDDQVEILNAQQSCRDRCKTTTAKQSTAVSSPLEADVCLCTIDCADYSLCCPDFAEYCVLGQTDELPGYTTEFTTVNQEDSRTRSIWRKNDSGINDIASISPDYFNENAIPINPKDDIDPITPVSALLPTKDPTFGNSSTRTKAKSSYDNTTRTTLQVPPHQSDLNTKETPFVIATTTATKKYVNLPTNQTGKEATRHQVPEKLHTDSLSLDVPSIVEAVCGILVAVCTVALIVVIYMKKRKSCKRGSKSSALSEDSDVRFLTSDEILDFTLARPSDNDEP